MLLQIVLGSNFLYFCLAIYTFFYPEHFVKFYVFHKRYRNADITKIKNKETDYIKTFRLVIRSFYLLSLLLMLLPETAYTGLASCAFTYVVFESCNQKNSNIIKTSTFSNLALGMFVIFIIIILNILHVL